MSEGYNGWSNWDTWCVSAHISNSEAAYNYCKDQTPDYIETYWSCCFSYVKGQFNIVNVNWVEVAAGLETKEIQL